MRVERTERIILTVEEANTLNELWQKINSLEIKDDVLDEICENLQDAITEFLGTIDNLEIKER